MASTVTLPYLEIELNKGEPGAEGGAKGGAKGKGGKGKVVYQVSQRVMNDYYLMQEGLLFFSFLFCFWFFLCYLFTFQHQINK